MTSTEPTIAPAPGKSCGDCMLCCKLPALAPLDKPMGKWCVNARPGKGCQIYDSRPAECRAFHCGWLIDASLGPEWKPDRAKFYIANFPDGNVHLMVDPGAPGAWKDERYYPTIKIAAARLLEQGKNLFAVIGRRVIVILPEKNIDVGVVPDGHRVRIEGRIEQGRLDYAAFIEPEARA